MSVYVPPPLLLPIVRAAASWVYSPSASWPQIRRRMHLAAGWPGAPKTVDVAEAALGGVPCEVLDPTGREFDRVLLYLHGGGYTTGSPRTHRALAGRLAQATRALTYVLDYRLAPEHPAPAAVDDAVAAYRALLDQGWRGDEIIVAGDSAGAGLSLVLALRVRELGLPAPAVLGLICPGVDASAEAEATWDANNQDAILTAPLVRRFLASYAAPEQRGLDFVSPLHADLADLPPMLIEAAERDVIVEGGRMLAQRAHQAGVVVAYREHPGLFHVFHVLAGILLQADLALDSLADKLLETMLAQRERLVLAG